MGAKPPSRAMAVVGYQLGLIFIYVLIVKKKENQQLCKRKSFCFIKIVFPMPRLFTRGIVYLYSPGTAPNGLGIGRVNCVLVKPEILVQQFS